MATQRRGNATVVAIANQKGGGRKDHRHTRARRCARAPGACECSSSTRTHRRISRRASSRSRHRSSRSTMSSSVIRIVGERLPTGRSSMRSRS